MLLPLKARLNRGRGVAKSRLLEVFQALALRDGLR